MLYNSENGRVNNNDDINLFNAELSKLIQHLEQLKLEIQEQKVPSQVHNLVLKKQSREFDYLSSKIEQLKNKLEFESGVYEHLKQINISLNLDEEYLHILEHGNFDKDVDLTKMEQSLAVFSDISEGKYKIALVEERNQEISIKIRDFLKRFIIYLSKTLVKSEAKGELVVHRSFYSTIKRFQFIYKFSKNSKEFYHILINSYVAKAKDLYNSEFKTHINRVSELISDSKSLYLSLDTLVKTYISLLECERSFLEMMEIQVNSQEIFSSVDQMIVDFIDIFYNKDPCIILRNLYEIESQNHEEKLGSLYNMLKLKQQALSEIFLQHMKLTKISFETADLAIACSQLEKGADFSRKVVRNIIAILKDSNCNSLKGAVIDLQLIFYLNLTAVDQSLTATLKSKIIPKLIDFVYSTEEFDDRISTLFSYLSKSRAGYNEAIAELRDMLLENCDNEKKASMNKLIDRATR